MFDRDQLKGARGMLGLSRPELAEKARLSVAPIKDFEEGRTITMNPSTSEKLISVIEGMGLEFIDGGVRKRQDMITRLGGDDHSTFIKLLDDIYHTMKGEGEVLYMFADDGESTEAVIEAELRIRKSGTKMRALAKQGNANFIYPIEEYRLIPAEYFINNLVVIYGTKVAFRAGAEILLLRDQDNADVQRNNFEFYWKHCPMPTHTTSEVRHV